ncbi:MAG: caspase family protein [Saprospiraceae bacterium]|nr:caspase family protein [Saprospiraceae bacterium]
MKNRILILIISFFIQSLSAQQKGVSPISTSNQQQSTHKTFALVVGISDYQDAAIPDLRFAERDAKAFVELLKSSGLGKLDDDHLKVLLGKEATNAQFAAALDWLMDEAKEGDQVIIYFSGHGDVESKTRSQQGFLLTWDSPSRTYIAGAMTIFWINEVISTLSAERKAKVILITDACRSGKLAGNDINGTQLTSLNLAKQYNNEIKILSCQPTEYSIEGEQWGGGRGVFSYYLVNGLFGFADNNNDQKITFSELDRYLEDHVPVEVSPISQVPLLIGKKTDTIAVYDMVLFTSLKSKKEGEVVAFSAIESRGIEEETLSKVDSLVKENYLKFKRALKEKNFLDPPGNNADELYNALIVEAGLKPIQNHMKRNYAAALQDEAQQFLNTAMVSDENNLNIRVFLDRSLYAKYASYFHRASELLGPNHYMYKNLKAKEYFFNGGVAYLKSPFIAKDTVVGNEALKWARRSLEMEPDMAMTYILMSQIFLCNFMNEDSARVFADRGISLAPKKPIIYSSLAEMLLWSEQPKKAKYYVDKAWAIDSNSIRSLNVKAKMLSLTGNTGEAERLFLKTIQLNPQFSSSYANLGEMYLRSFRLLDAEKQFFIAIEKDSFDVIAWKLLGYLNLIKNKLKDADHIFTKAYQIDREQVFYVDFDFACLYSLSGKEDLAFSSLEKALQNKFSDYSRLNSIPFLHNLRMQKERWDALMNKYFPDKM